MAEPVAIEPDRLLGLAEEPVTHRPAQGRPRTIRLRQAVSNADYALFDELARETVAHLLPSASPSERLRLTRTIGHAQIKQACELVASRIALAKSRPEVRPMIRRLREGELSDLAGRLCDLQ